MPSVNNFFPSYSDIVFKTNGLQFVGVTSIKYSGGLKRGRVKGTQKLALGITNGSYEADGEVEFILVSAQLLMNSLNFIGAPLGGYAFVPLSVTVAYQPIGPVPLIIDSFVCYLGKQDSDNKVSEDASMRKFSLEIPGSIFRNGIPDVTDLNSIGAVG